MSKKLRSEDLPKISIIIPSFNKVGFISRTLDSIISQNYRNLEIIIQDGGSTDGTLDVVKEYARKYPEIIRWESGKDNGQLEAINKGAKKATGEIISYINADDLYKKHAFEGVARKYKENRNSLWFMGFSDMIDGKGDRIANLAVFYKKILALLNKYPLLLLVNYIMQPAVFLTKTAFVKYGPFTGTERFVTEYDLWLKLGLIQMPAVIPLEIASFRMSGGNISSVQYRNLLEKDMNIVKRYTRNKLVLALHRLHNCLRVWMVKTL